MKDRINHSKSYLKNIHKQEIDKVRSEHCDPIEKSRVLKGISHRFEDKSKYGDDDALDLMSKATLARANVLLEKR